VNAKHSARMEMEPLKTFTLTLMSWVQASVKPLPTPHQVLGRSRKNTFSSVATEPAMVTGMMEMNASRMATR